MCRQVSCASHPHFQPPLPDTITWRECAKCGHVFTDGYFTDEACAVLFSRTMPNTQVGYDFEGQRPLSSHIVERVAAFAPTGVWLDLGFGNGSLLFAADEWGYTAVGADLRRENVAALARLGIESHYADVTRLDHDGRYAVISMADVLEHMPFPKLGLAAARRLLHARGVLFLSLPNSESVPWQILDAQGANPYWGEIEHYHNFSRSRLYALLREIGFQPVHFSVSERYRLCMEVIARRID